MLVYHYSLKGIREANEDSHKIVLNQTKQNTSLHDFNFYSIYDGHGGKKVSEYVAEQLYYYYLHKTAAYNLKELMKNQKLFEEYTHRTYTHIQKKLVHEKKNFSKNMGSTAIMALEYFQGSKHFLQVVNLGDCRAVLCNKYNIGVALTKDHKPDTLEERRRIEQLGGVIEFDKEDEIYRINGLALSRAFGDLDTHEYVSYLPDVYSYEIQNDDKFVIIACDGLWDVMSNQDAVDWVLNFGPVVDDKITELKSKNEQELIEKKTSKNIAQLMAKHAINNLESTDNVSVLIVFFRKIN
jgi:serine/threonine protein phosphatase PrpC